ncbi:MAG: protease SohB, partial [Stenotrophobium sp.]
MWVRMLWSNFVIDFLMQYGLFLAKTVTLVVAITLIVGSFVSLVRAAREHAHERLEVKSINHRFEQMADILNHELLDDAQLKQQKKARKNEEKKRAKALKHGQSPRPRLFTFNFDGDLHATAATALREEISAVLQVARKEDEVLLRLESEGGLVHAYGLAASQLTRIRERGIRLTVAVDMVAASGGYLMACVADKIIAAPFAILGSIGVVAQLPNFNRLLKKHNVDFELHTAGQYKRTLTLFGENTDEGRAKFEEELEDTHALFKSFVTENRPGMDMEKIATGEHWYGTRALTLR